MTSSRNDETKLFARKPPSASKPGGDGPHDSNIDWGGSWNRTVAAVIPKSLASCFKATLGVTVALYILNQKHMLPRPLAAVVSKLLFWPTLPITVSRRIGRWETVIDDTVVVGGAPFGFAKLPEKLYEMYGVSAAWSVEQ